MRKTGFFLVLCACFALSTASMAAAYWDYQGNLPDATGKRYFVKITNGTNTQSVRMSWTSGSHCMRFLKMIFADGSWFHADICGDNQVACNPSYDCRLDLGVTSIYDKFGCWNPPNLSTVYVNCRATNPL
jgi:hypothetical protein